MSATVLREKNQTTLPADVVEAAGLKPSDQVDWRFEEGEIRGRKLASRQEQSRLTLVKRKGRHMLSENVSREEILAAIRADREGK